MDERRPFLLHLVKLPEQCRFAGPAGADDDDFLSFPNVERDVHQHRRVTVGDTDVVQIEHRLFFDNAHGDCGFQYWPVGRVVGGDETGAREGVEQVSIRHAEKGIPDFLYEAFAVFLLHITANCPVVVRVGGRFPDDADFAGVDIARCGFVFPRPCS